MLNSEAQSGSSSSLEKNALAKDQIYLALFDLKAHSEAICIFEAQDRVPVFVQTLVRFLTQINSP